MKTMKLAVLAMTFWGIASVTNAQSDNKNDEKKMPTREEMVGMHADRLIVELGLDDKDGAKFKDIYTRHAMAQLQDHPDAPGKKHDKKDVDKKRDKDSDKKHDKKDVDKKHDKKDVDKKHDKDSDKKHDKKDADKKHDKGPHMHGMHAPEHKTMSDSDIDAEIKASLAKRISEAEAESKYYEELRTVLSARQAQRVMQEGHGGHHHNPMMAQGRGNGHKGFGNGHKGFGNGHKGYRKGHKVYGKGHKGFDPRGGFGNGHHRGMTQNECMHSHSDCQQQGQKGKCPHHNPDADKHIQENANV